MNDPLEMNPRPMTMYGWLTTILTLTFWIRAGVAPAQEQLPAPPPAVAPGRPVKSADANAPGDLREMYERVDRLKKQRRSLSADFRAPEQTTLHGESSRARGHRDLSDLKRNMVRESAEISERSQRIRGHLQRLRGLVRDREFCKTPAPPTSQAVTDETTEPAATLNPPDAPPSAVSTTTVPTVEVRPVTPAISEPAKPPTEELVPDPVIQALTMVNGPVDQLSLANNLYGAGEFQLALEIYQKVDRSQLTADALVWVEFQQANCHRRLGNQKAAERGYRIVTRRDKSSWIGKNARWWLVVGDETRQLQQRTTQIVAGLDALRGSKDVNAETKTR